MKKTTVFLIAIIMFTGPAFCAEKFEGESVIVTASHGEEKKKDTTAVVTVITKEEIEESGAATVEALLKREAGLQVNTFGQRGRLSSVMIRGANSNQTMVLIDGAPANDPTTGGFDFSTMTTDNIERIEIVRGQGSAVHGSEAGGGVINILTSGGTEGYQFSALAVGGDMNTNRTKAVVRGGGEKLNISFSAGDYHTDNEIPNEQYDNRTFSGRLDFNEGPNRIILTARSFEADKEIGVETDYDFAAMGLVQNFDDNSYQKTDSGFYTLSCNLSPEGGDWTQKLFLSYAGIRYDYADSADEDEPFTGDLESVTRARRRTVSLTEIFRFGEHMETLYGLEYEDIHGAYDSFYSDPFWGVFPTEYEHTVINRALFSELKYTGEWLAAELGLRADDYTSSGGTFNGRLGLMFRFPANNIRLKVACGTSFRSPTLNELYFPSYGNPDLEPEEGLGLEWGLLFSAFRKRLDMEFYLFRNDYEDLIATDPATFTAANIDEATVEGAEMKARLGLPADFTIDANYTYLDTEDENTGERLLRRPRNRGSIILKRTVEQYTAGVEGIFVGSRRDIDIIGYPEELPSYEIMNAFLDVRLTGRFSLKGRMENITDEEYVVLAGYPALGRNFIVSLELNLR